MSRDPRRPSAAPISQLEGGFPPSSLIHNRDKEPKDFYILRPDQDGSLKDFCFFTFAEDGANIHSSAYGVKLTGSAVVIAVAFVDPFASLGPEGFQSLYQHAKRVQTDFYGLELVQECKFGPRCNPRGRDCTYYHGRPTECRYRPAAERVLASLKRADGKRGPGFLTEKPSHAVMMQLAFPWDPATGLVDWSSMTPAFSTAAITLDYKGTDAKVGSIAARIEAEGEEDSDDKKTTLKFLTQFTEHRVFNGASTFQQRFGTRAEVLFPSAPSYGRGNSVSLEHRPRPFLNHRRFLLDTLTDVFNEQACVFLAGRRCDDCLCAREWTFPPELHSVVGPTNVPASALCALGIPFRNILPSLRPKLLYTTASDLLAAATDGAMKMAKFNTPLRDFSSLHNVAVLHCCIAGQPAPQPLHLVEVPDMAVKLGKLEDCEIDKMNFVYRIEGAHKGVLVSGPQQKAVALGFYRWKVCSPAKDLVAPFTF